MRMMAIRQYDAEAIEHTVPARLTIENAELTINVLFDTGALQSNYLSKEVADWLTRQGGERILNPAKICSAFDECQIANDLFKCHIYFTNLTSKDSLSLPQLANKVSRPRYRQHTVPR